MRCGALCIPRAAIVAYADASSHGVTSAPGAPSDIESPSVVGIGDSIPHARAVAATASTPTTCATLTVGTFNESTRHSRTFTTPLCPRPSPFAGKLACALDLEAHAGLRRRNTAE